MTLVDRLRAKFIDAGFAIGGRDDVSVAAFAWYARKAEKTIRNTINSPGKWPRSERVGGSRRFPLESILSWDIARCEALE